MPFPDGGQQHDRLGTYPPRDKRQHLPGRAIQPLRVLDDQ
jgi:hypothetical protein